MNFKEPSYNFSAVADPGCLSRILDVYPESRILDPISNNNDQRGGGKKIGCFITTKLKIFLNYFIFEHVKKKSEPIDKEL